jgi:hypothetical protein
VHTALCVGTSPAACKSQSFVGYDEISVTSFLIEIFRRLNSHFTSFYTQKVVHTAFSLEQALQLANRNHLSVMSKSPLLRS